MSNFTLPVNYTDSGRIGSISTLELAKTLPHTTSMVLPVESDLAAGKNIDLTLDPNTRQTIISTVDDPTFSSIDLARVGAPITSLVPETTGFLSQTIGSEIYTVLTTGNVGAVAPLIVAPTSTGAAFAISPDPGFNTVNVGGALLSFAGGQLQVDTGTGPSPVLTQANDGLEPGSNISIVTNPTTGGQVISVVPGPTFSAVNVGGTILGASPSGQLEEIVAGIPSILLSQANTVGSPNILVTPMGPMTTISLSPNPVVTSATFTSGTIATLLNVGPGGFLQETIGGTTYPLLTSANAITSVVGVGNILTSTTNGVATINTTNTPSFTNVNVGGTVLSAGTGGRLQETIGTTTTVLLTQGDIVGAAPVTVTPVGTSSVIGIASDPTFLGAMKIVDSGTTSASLIVSNAAGTGAIGTNNLVISNGAGIPTASIAGSSGTIVGMDVRSMLFTVNGSNGYTGVTTIVTDATGNLIRTNTGGSSILLTRSYLPNVVSGNLTTIGSGETTTITTVPNPTFATSVTTPALGITSTAGVTALTANSAGFLQQTVGGTVYPIPTSAVSTITGTTPIIVTPITGGYNVSISPNPTFSNVIVTGAIGASSVQTSSLTLGTSVITSSGGTIQVTNGGTTTNVLTSTTVVGGSNIVVTPSGSGISIATSTTPSFSTITTTGLATLGGGINTTNIVASGTVGVTGNISGGSLTVTGASTLNTLSVTGAAIVGGTLGVTGQLNAGTIVSSGTITTTTLGATTSVVTPVVVVGGNSLTSTGTQVLLNNSNVATTANSLPDVAGLGTNPLTQRNFLFTVTFTGTTYSIAITTGGLYTAPTTFSVIRPTLANNKLSIAFTTPSTVGRVVTVTPITTSTSNIVAFCAYNASTGNIDIPSFINGSNFVQITTTLLSSFVLSVQAVVDAV